MSLHYIIDGYNLIHHPSFAPHSKRKDVKFALLDFIRTKRPCGSLRNKVTVVFDGYASGFSWDDGSITVLFSSDASADERIKRLLEARQDHKNVVVVSDDNEVRDFARLCGAQPRGIEEFVCGPGKKRAAAHAAARDAVLKPELTQSEMLKINRELRGLWLKE
ncbi:MAG: NYN domain-containing protein [Candidatus Omnitrophica bacterium]|nr:NYN domain-containing protein [Candidatus Omnitrophota bacterium]